MSCWMQQTCRVYQQGDRTCDQSTASCIKWIMMDALYKASLLPESARRRASITYDKDGTDKELFKSLSERTRHIEEYVADGVNAFFYSRVCGNGKTLWAIRFIQSYLEAVWHKSSLECKALFVGIPSFFLQLKASLSGGENNAQYILDNVEKADLVVFDEVATKSITAFEQEHLLSMVNRRLDLHKSSIYTSNMSGLELRKLIGDRLYSRITTASELFEFKGQDKRFLRT